MTHALTLDGVVIAEPCVELLSDGGGTGASGRRGTGTCVLPFPYTSTVVGILSLEWLLTMKGGVIVDIPFVINVVFGLIAK